MTLEVSAAIQIYYTRFDAAFFELPLQVRARIESKVDEMGLRLATFPHHRLAGSNRYRLRVGDYRIIYAFDIAGNILHLLASSSHFDLRRSLASGVC